MGGRWLPPTATPLATYDLLPVSTCSCLPLPGCRYYFGREVAAANRHPLATYDLKQRRYLGPTSMDTEMAFLMCNMCQVGGVSSAA